MKEKDLFEPLKSYLINVLACDSVYAEVGNRDVIAIKDDIVYGIEMKTSLNFKVMEQAEKALKCCDYSFIAVPRPKTKHRSYVLNLLKERGLGLIYIDGLKSRIVHWGSMSSKKRYDIRKYINEDFHSRTIGGVKTGDGITEYGEMIQSVKEYLLLVNDWVNLNDILENVPVVSSYYKNPRNSLRSTLKEHWNLDWCDSKKVGRVVYFKYKS